MRLKEFESTTATRSFDRTAHVSHKSSAVYALPHSALLDGSRRQGPLARARPRAIVASTSGLSGGKRTADKIDSALEDA